MMTQICRRFKRQLPSLSASRLYNEQTFYRAFEQDLAFCRDEAIIERPHHDTPCKNAIANITQNGCPWSSSSYQQVLSDVNSYPTGQSSRSVAKPHLVIVLIVAKPTKTSDIHSYNKGEPVLLTLNFINIVKNSLREQNCLFYNRSYMSECMSLY